MGRLNESMKHRGYDVKERAYVYCGLIGGALAPIVGVRSLFGYNSDNLAEEGLAWGASLVINASIIVLPPHAPLPLYTGLGGMMVGLTAAQSSRDKRLEKKRVLEKSL
ncbi:MAG: hypothetical protein ABIF88_02035 [archaeon]